jgi:hypothetical protein
MIVVAEQVSDEQPNRHLKPDIQVAFPMPKNSQLSFPPLGVPQGLNSYEIPRSSDITKNLKPLWLDTLFLGLLIKSVQDPHRVEVFEEADMTLRLYGMTVTSNPNPPQLHIEPSRGISRSGDTQVARGVSKSKEAELTAIRQGNKSAYFCRLV